MKAALYDTHGPAAEVLRVEEVEPPEPGPGEVRVKVAVSAINPTDYKSRSGATPRPMDGFQIPHHDGAGTPRLAPSSKEALSGRGTAWRPGSTVHSAAVPHRRPDAAIQVQTRWPTRAGSTPSPTASITPAPSWCGIWNPSMGRGVAPLRLL